MKSREQKKREKQRRRQDLAQRVKAREAYVLMDKFSDGVCRVLDEVGIDYKKITHPDAATAILLAPTVDNILAQMAFAAASPFSSNRDLSWLDDAMICFPAVTQRRIDYDGSEVPPTGLWSQSFILSTVDNRLGCRVRRMSTVEAYANFDRRLVDRFITGGKKFHEVTQCTFGEVGFFDSKKYYILTGDDVWSKGILVDRSGAVNFAARPLEGEAVFVENLGLSCPIAKLVHNHLRHTWSVRLSSDGVLGIRLPVNASSVRHMFAHRDIPDGYSRRKALLHWVCEHWRTSRADPADETYVREHMRGTTDFDWCGFKCRLHAPADVLENERLKEARAAMTPDETRRPKV